MTNKAIAVPAGNEAAVAGRLPALAVLAIGLVLVYCTGFAASPVAHNATHDTRHANGFPCH